MCIDDTGVMPVCDELPGRSRCISEYRTHTQQADIEAGAASGVDASEDITSTDAPTSGNSEVLPTVRPGTPFGKNRAEASADIAKGGDLSASSELAQTFASISTTGSIVPANAAPAKGHRKNASVGVPKDKTAPASSSSSSASRNIASYGSNLSVGGELDAQVTWEQLRDGGTSGVSVQGGTASGKARRGKRATDGSASSRGMLSLSGLCGRQWGQDGVSAELNGSWTVADNELELPGSTASIAHDLSLGSVLRRPFIGETSRAVRISRANKSYAKLNGATHTSTKAPVAASDRKAVEIEDLSTVSQNLAAALLSKDGNEEKRRKGSDEESTIGFSPRLPISFSEQVMSSQPSPAKPLSSSSALDNSFDLSESFVPLAVPTSAVEATSTGPGALLRVVLKPQERLQVTVIVCPSPDYVDEATGTAYGGELRNRTIPLQLQWRQVWEDPAADDAGLTSPFTAKLDSGTHRLSVQFRSCVSLISVQPSPADVYELGMCNVGEHRTVVLELHNASQLPAVVFPLVDSDVLDVAEQEVRIPASETRQVRLGYLAKTEDAEYWDRVTLVNGYNIPNSQVMRIKSRNVDTQQILLHSMFYKLVTYNNLRQLQVAFDRCLINMPNLKVFCIKNVHSATLRMRLCWKSQSGFRLFLVRAPAASQSGNIHSTSASSSDLPDKDPLLLLCDAPDAGESRMAAEVTGSSRMRASNQQDDIEDLKWGDNPNDFSSGGVSKSTRYKRSLSMQPVRHPNKSGGSGGATEDSIVTGMSGDDGSVNYGKGELFAESKSSAVGLSRDIVSVLDLDMSMSQQASSFGGNSASNGKDGNEGGALLPSHPRSRSVDNKEVRFSVAPSPVEPAAPQLTFAADESAGTEAVRLNKDTTSDFENILGQFGKEGFPFTMIEGDDWSVKDNDFESARANPAHWEMENYKNPLQVSVGEALQGGRNVSQKVKGSRQVDDRDRDRDRPHSIGGTSTNNAPSVSVQSTGAVGSGDSKREKSETELRVKALQRYYAELRFMIDNSGRGGTSCLREITPESFLSAEAVGDSAFDVGALIEIPAGASHRFALLYEPVQRAGADDIEEYAEVRRSDAVHIVLPDMGAADVATSLDLNKHLYDPADALMHDDMLQLQPHALPAGGLRPRALPVRASLVRSEMVVIQKNISFGRTVLGEKSSKGVTVVNRSSVPCLYTISKSGSISSGFLQVLGGRKGIIPAFSSKVIEFIFKPTLPGTFEEVLMINNVLNPRDAQAVTIKARVSHTETFVISEIGPPDSADKEPSTSLDSQDIDCETQYRSQLRQFLANPTTTPAASIVKTLTQHLHDCAIGGEPADAGNNCLTFRIKNVTSKSRQFIVDASHVHAVEVLAVTAPVLPPLDSPARVPAASTSPVVEKLAAVFPFEPIPEILQSVLSLRCRFESELLAGKSTAAADGGAGADNSLSPAERKALEDSLEQFQQKLKIAIRKNKAEKIEKYQKKIDKVIIALQSNKNTASAEPASVQADALVPTEEEAAHAAPVAERVPPSDPTTEVAASGNEVVSESSHVAPITGQPALPHVGESEVSYHFHLEPEQEKLVRVRISFLPGSAYKYWSGLLPFQGFLRIFECKNEDHVKLVRFGAMVRSIRRAVANAVPFSQPTTSHKGAEDRISRSPFQLASATEEEISPLTRELSDVIPLTPLSNTQAFITTVAQWSSLPTREVYPKYRQLPNHLLPMCVKLVRASKDRVMHGSLSVASLVEQAGVLSVSVDEEFSSKVSAEYATYNPQRHGPVVFAIAHHGDASAALQPEDELVKGEGSTLATEIGSSSAVGRDKRERWSRRHESESRISAGSKVDFSIQWLPPADLSAAKQSSTSAEIGSEEPGRSLALRIIGAVKVQLKVGDQLIGLPQSIPFIGVLEHKSIFSVSKYFAFEQISVGSYCTCQVPITNTSPTEELHYLVSSEEVSASSRAVGTMDITSGQAGVVRPNSTKQLALFFVASSAGKYEQKLWVRNVQDSFDQKRIVVQANVTVAQTKFVAFPDLESSTDGAFEKYKPIDLGLVQIQRTETSELLPVISAMDLRCFYELRVQNVSGKALLVTAVSNLKSQCFIYSDEACTQLAIYSPVPASTVTTLYVKIRPTALAPAQTQSSQDIAPPLTSGTAGTNFAPEATDTALSAGAGEDKNKAKRNATAGGAVTSELESREMKGGIKLVFFAAEAKLPIMSDGTSSSAAGAQHAHADAAASAVAAHVSSFPLDSNPLKLFETAISFKATVGRSHLKLSAASNACELQYMFSQQGSNYFVGTFELRNISKLFPLEYAYVPNEGSECVTGDTGSYKWWGALTASAVALRKTEKKIKILDGQTGSLQPGQCKCVTYVVLHAAEASGLVLCPVKVANVSTMYLCSRTFATFLDPQSLRSSLFYKENVLALPEPMSGEAEISEGVQAVHPTAQPMVPVQCSGTVWVYYHDRDAKDSGGSAVSHADGAVGRAVADGEQLTPGQESSHAQQYIVQGASKVELGSWLFTNTNAKSITFFPASDLPVSVTIAAYIAEAEGCVDNAALEEVASDAESDTEVAGRPFTVRKPQPAKVEGMKYSLTPAAGPSALSMSGSASSDYNSHISPALLRWRESLKRCGGAFTLEAGCTVRVSVGVRRGIALRDSQLQALGGARRLEEGRCGQMSGVVVFLQAAHSLQSLFNPAPSAKPPTTEGAGASKHAEVFATKDSRYSALQDHIDILPIVNIASLVCDVAAPSIQLEKSSLSLGKFRCNRDVSFEIVVENTSDVDVPCCIDNLPGYMNIEKYAIHPLKNQQNSKEGSVLELDVATLDSPVGMQSTQHLFLDSQQVLSQFSSPRNTEKLELSKTERSLGAQKLHWWLATNGNSISNQSPHLQHQQQYSVPASLPDSARQRRGSKEQSALSDELMLAHTFSDTASAADFADADAADELEEGTALQLSSLEVNHERYLHQYQNELTLDAIQSELFQLHQALMGDRADHHHKAGRLFAVPAKRQFRLTVHLKVPLMETQLLETVLMVKNLTSAVVDFNKGPGRYMLDQDGRVVVADQRQLKVRLQIDASRALEVIAAIDEPLQPRAASSQLQLAADRKGDEPATNTTSASFTRLLKDPFMIPPPAHIESVVVAADDISGEGGLLQMETSFAAAHSTEFCVPRSIRAKSKVAKTHCRFSIKNKLADNIRVLATVEVNPALVGLLDLKVRFQTNNSGSIDLEPEESCAVKVRVIPELSGRVTSAVLVEQVSLVLPSRNVGIACESPVLGSLTESATDAPVGHTEHNDGAKMPAKKADSSLPPLKGVPGAGKDTSAGSSSVNIGPSGGGNPVLFGTVRLTPVHASRPTSPTALDVTDGDVESLYKHDVIVLDIVGYLQAAPTIITSLALPLPALSSTAGEDAGGAPADGKDMPVLEFRAKVCAGLESSNETSQPGLAIDDNTHLLARALSPSLPTASGPVAGGISSMGLSLSVPTGRPPPSQPALLQHQSQQPMPVLDLSHNTMSLFLANPSSTIPLNYEIKSQSYRHAGMRLLLAGTATSGLSESDTFALQAEPARGSLGPSTAIAVKLRLVPGDAAGALKSSTTLNADIPDVQMRERRLRSHHNREPTLAAVVSGGALGATSGNLAGMAGIAEKALDVPMGEEQTKDIAKPVSSSAGPYTIACMPVEVHDTDYLSHPPRIVFAYLTSDVPIPIIATQSIGESSRGKGVSTISAASLSTDTPPIREKERDWQEAPRTITLTGTASFPSPLCVMSLGQVLQRKEVLEWPVVMENRSAWLEIPYSLHPVFRSDTTSWLTLGQSGGVLAPRSKYSVMIYFRRSLPPGCYVSYLLVQNLREKAEVCVIKVSMDIVSDAKRAASSGIGASVASLSSLSSMGLSTARRDRSDENLSASGASGGSAEKEAAVNELTVNTVASMSSDTGVGVSEAFPARAPTPSVYAPAVPVAVRPVFAVSVPSSIATTGSDLAVSCTSTEDDSETHGSAFSVGLSLSPISTPDVRLFGKSFAPHRAPPQLHAPVVAVAATPTTAQRSPSSSAPLAVRNLTDVPLTLTIDFDDEERGAGCAASAPHLEVKGAEERNGLLCTKAGGRWELSLQPRETVNVTVNCGRPDNGGSLQLEEVGEDEPGTCRIAEDADGADNGVLNALGALSFTCSLFEDQKRRVKMVSVVESVLS